MVNIVVDGETFSVDKNGNLITELKKHNIEIPHFCYHEALGVSGNCRMCLIEVVGQKRPQIACNTPISEGMEIKINSELTRKVQKGILELEFINHPIDCPVCDQAGECSLQEYYMCYDKGDSRVSLAQKVRKPKKEDFGSNVIHDAERCVLCRRCVRFTEICTKTYELGVGNRGEHSEIILFNDKKINNPYAGNIVDVCPVGAMTSADFRFKKRVWHLKSSPSICQGCERGCAIWVDSSQDKYEYNKIYRFRPRVDNAVNGHFICDFGRYSYKNEQIIVQENSDELISNLKNELDKTSGEFDILITSSLSLEEMFCVINFAKEYNARIYGWDDFRDESFCDSEGLMLRYPNKTANKQGLDYFYNNSYISKDISDIQDRIIVFHLGGELDFLNLKDKNITFIGSCNSADIVCASAYHRDGHSVNVDNKLRFSKAAFLNLSPSIEQIIQTLSQNSYKFDKDILKAFE
ncbi:2Fe-2S iron-sulfur cluster-binding protein [Campylobacter fetus]|uniref:2Fe-2S iron-sulfur cluster-binding protein n=1 Tax=Campylobacter fetus TaxID=196 RepID=UPI00073ACFFC|nr:2Fe-2S iron-sulfur cluster-binding protein [Campylobacter fetus]ALV64155.1 NADH:quinone oxidoreductase I, chain G [Campylobacter fetus subsp. testudinum Sp3]OCR84901.1 ferredoxin [Campylobacter fetus subsp. testudinum]OCR86719.1 ferredoxin [Campylobacter fetus subsp. testudinum]